MTTKLVIEKGEREGEEFLLTDGTEWVLGSDSFITAVAPDTTSKPLTIEKSADGFFLRKEEGGEPVLLNNQPLEEDLYFLENGDKIAVGETLFSFELDPSDSLEEEEPPVMVSDSPASEPDDDDEGRHDTIFEEGDEPVGELAKIDFGVVDTGRWLLKVVSGPNNGAEYYMQAGNSYTLGTDPDQSEIVFYDTSVSRQHAKITVSPEDTLTIEDLKSRNGLFVDGKKVEGFATLTPGHIVSIGTTSFIVYDREGGMETIVSPILSAKAALEEEKKAEKELEAEAGSSLPVEPSTFPFSKAKTIFLSVLAACLLLIGTGIYTLFHESKEVVKVQENADELIGAALKPFPAVKWTFNKTNNSLLLLGHVLTQSDLNQVLYNLSSLKFIKNIDSSGVVIDEGVWNEINSLFSSNRNWQGISIHSPAAGQFVLSGELQTRKQAEQLSSYLSLNFPYLDLLKKDIVVEEDVNNKIVEWLRDAKLTGVVPKMTNGEVSLTGVIPSDQDKNLDTIIEKIKQIRGVRVVVNNVKEQSLDMGVVDLSTHYQVSGKSRVGDRFTVVINGRILSQGDDLDGMTLTKVTGNRILLEKGKEKFRIDY